MCKQKEMCVNYGEGCNVIGLESCGRYATKAGVKNDIGFTRAQYMAGECTHAEYMEQFVSDALVEMVGSRIGVDRIRASVNPYFNDIPLHEWDHVPFTHDKKMQQLEGFYSKAFQVSVLKACARRIKELSIATN
jgi:hypothetical protein